MNKAYSSVLVSLLFVFAVLFAPSLVLAAESPTYGAVQSIGGSFIMMIAGCDGYDNATFSSPDPVDDACNSGTMHQAVWFGGNGGYNTSERAALPTVNRGILAMIKHQPASSATYVADLMQNVGPSNQAYAQGLGFASLTPILGIWKAFRNISYFFFVLAFMVVGFAIMFRTKINPQTVVNIQLALPRLVITLLLITFSYAIAGLMIDLMYLVIFLMIVVLSATVFGGDTTGLTQIALTNNFPSNIINFLFGGFGDDPTSGFGDVVNGMGAMIANILGSDQGGKFDLLSGNVLEWVGGMGLGIIFTLVFLVVILWQSFKVFFALLTTYIQIILLIITAPLRLLLNIYPGSNAFMSWIKELVGHLAVFPAVIFMLYLAMMLMGRGTAENIGYSGTSGGFVPPQLNFGAADAIQFLLGVGVLLSMPNVVDEVKKFFGAAGGGGGGGAGGAFAGGLAGGAFGSVLNPMGAPFRAVGGAAQHGFNTVAGTAMATAAGNYIGNTGVAKSFRNWQRNSQYKQNMRSQREIDEQRTAGYGPRVDWEQDAAADQARDKQDRMGDTGDAPDFE